MNEKSGWWEYAGYNSFGTWYLCSNCNAKHQYNEYCPSCGSHNTRFHQIPQYDIIEKDEVIVRKKKLV